MTAHETRIPGPAADFGAALAAQIPVLKTARTRLRAPRLSDMDAWTEVLCGPATEHLGGPFTRDQAFAEFASTVSLWLLRGHGLWTVETKAKTRGKAKAPSEILGFVLIGFEPGDQEPELGFLFRQMAEGQGLAFEAATAARDFALVSLRLPSLVSYVAPGNERSARLAARLGAQPEPGPDGCTAWRHHPLAGASA